MKKWKEMQKLNYTTTGFPEMERPHSIFLQTVWHEMFKVNGEVGVGVEGEERGWEGRVRKVRIKTNDCHQLCSHGGVSF